MNTCRARSAVLAGMVFNA